MNFRASRIWKMGAGKDPGFPPEEDCYVYRSPGSSAWQYFLSIPTKGEERKSTKQKDKNEAWKVTLNRRLEVMMRQVCSEQLQLLLIEQSRFSTLIGFAYGIVLKMLVLRVRLECAFNPSFGNSFLSCTSTEKTKY